MYESPVGLITGAARGIGYGIAERLVTDGWHVIVADIDSAACSQAAAALGARATPVALDVRDEARVAATLNDVKTGYGRLDGLVNNAGISDPVSGPIEDLALHDWQRWLDSHLTGAFLMCKHALPLLRRQRGAIVNIASTRALQSEPHSEAYAASKGGLVAFSHALAISAGPEVRVNAINPGWIDSRSAAAKQAEPLAADDHAQHPSGRAGEPADVAALAAFLLGSESGFVTGQAWTLDGGMTKRMRYDD